MELVALLSEGKETWAQASGLIKRGEWDKIIIVGDSSARDFSAGKEHEFVEFSKDNLVKMKKELLEKLKPVVKGTEVALSIASGTGKEHMALISALLSVPVGIRFTALTKEGIIFM
ncbi:hypothetical protein A3K73_03445 [Candidatus Pacearchaeota archaeon RBG_13_36_9]|nr:MAG: hypothetical protein A3K73_03445 [Candidatus Pacearchaeota archaeon RBG_13_36_9]